MVFILISNTRTQINKQKMVSHRVGCKWTKNKTTNVLWFVGVFGKWQSVMPVSVRSEITSHKLSALEQYITHHIQKAQKTAYS